METRKPISPLRQRMIDDMRMRKLCDKHQAGYSRPRVSDDNAYAEALFRTAKYR